MNRRIWPHKNFGLVLSLLPDTSFSHWRVVAAEDLKIFLFLVSSSYFLLFLVLSCSFLLLVVVGLCWFLLVLVGSCWSLLVTVGHCWFLLVLVGSCWFLLVLVVLVVLVLVVIRVWGTARTHHNISSNCKFLVPSNLIGTLKFRQNHVFCIHAGRERLRAGPFHRLTLGSA